MFDFSGLTAGDYLTFVEVGTMAVWSPEQYHRFLAIVRKTYPGFDDLALSDLAGVVSEFIVALDAHLETTRSIDLYLNKLGDKDE